MLAYFRYLGGIVTLQTILYILLLEIGRRILYMECLA